MRPREERQKYKKYKYLFKGLGSDHSLKYKHGVYTLRFTNREGPGFRNLYIYTLSNTSLDDLLDQYHTIKAKEHV